MRRSHPLSSPLPGRRRHAPPWLWNGVWLVLVVSLSVGVLVLTAH